MRRIERLINLIAALLETRRPMTAEEIRERIAGYDQDNFEAFRRAFERDKEALRAMGIPLELRPTDPFVDQADGYIIPKAKYYLPELDLEPDELAALRIAAQAVLGAGDNAGAGLLKLSIDEPAGSWSASRVVWGADVAAEQPALGPLYSALLERRRVRFDYRAGSGEQTSRSVDVYGLVHRRGHWYAVGRDADKDDLRSFKVSRITSAVETLEDVYELPPGFDAAARVPESWAVGDAPEQAVVRFDAAMRWWAEQNLGDLQMSDGPDGSIDVEVPVSNPDALVAWAIEFADAVEIVAPGSLRRRVVEHLSPFLGTAPAAGSRGR